MEDEYNAYIRPEMRSTRPYTDVREGANETRSKLYVFQIQKKINF